MGKTILVLNGPNLNLLGTREPEIYGHTTLEDVQALCEAEAQHYGLTIDFRQSNFEGELVTWVQEARKNTAGLIINAGALTHTSIVLLDALKAYTPPIVEVHLSNIFARESFRHHSYISPEALGVICGLGAEGYALAIRALAKRIAH